MIHKSLLQIIPFRSSGRNLQRIRSLKFTRGIVAHPSKGNLIMPIKGSQPLGLPRSRFGVAGMELAQIIPLGHAAPPYIRFTPPMEN